MKKSLVITLSVIALVAITFVFLFRSTQPHVTFSNGTRINVELADSFVERTRGLAERESLEPDSGMLFVYPSAREGLGMWMRDMNFALDIIWMHDGEVVCMAEDAQPNDSLDREVYECSHVANYILEVNAGVVENVGLELGDEVEIII